MAEAAKRERWTSAQWSRWQEARLAEVLDTAARHVPFYHGKPAPSIGIPGMDLMALLPQWPILQKRSLRAGPRSFLDRRLNAGHLWCEHTSGTTGTPVTLWQSKRTLRAWYALVEARWRGWYGLSRHDRWAIFGGQLVSPVTQSKPPYWVWNRAMQQLYLSTYHLSAEAARAYLAALCEYRVRYLWGYASALTSLARFVLDQHLEVPRLATVISNAEPLYDHHRDIIRAAFQCPVHDTYGMSEMVCAASECEHGTMHLWPEVGIYEVLKDGSDEPVKHGETGRLISTGLLNLEMPLIRYETGDRIALAPPGSSCACGRTLPILKRIEGRSDDLIVTPSGRQVGRLDPVFKRDLPIAEAQIVQDAPDHLLVRIVQALGYSDSTESTVRHALQERLDGMRVDFEYCTSIPRSRNGKFKAVVSLLRNGSRVAD